MAVIEILLNISSSFPNEVMEQWRREGGKIVGYFCSYVPEELIHAVGALPVRIRATGSADTSDGDAYLSAYNCTFTRHALDQILKGKFDFLDGIVALNSCDHIRRLFDIIAQKAPRPFMQLLNVPHTTTDGTCQWYLNEISRLKQALEKHFGVEITDEKLRGSIRLCNETRSLLKRIHETRKKPDPPLTGAEMLGITVAATAMPKEQFNAMLSRLLGELESRVHPDKYRARIMLVAGLLDDPEFLKIIEGQGALIVAESLCFGSRWFWNPADESLPPMEALADRYMNHPPCPRMIDGHERRFAFIREMMEAYSADGIICERLKFCDLWAGESTLLRWTAREAGIPLLALEKEYTSGGLGQLRTRVQSFIENMGK
ncbi:2-hydroxyacyl-CoA dehydratase [Candidatus Poribacteria bacterium]|nr:2-hydroxyacyl-CoA dehydratase [Candidatus Poribacteria bacterium]